MSSPICCRSCGTPLSLTFVDLGDTPLANSYLTADELALPERTYPLHARVCQRCLLVQLAAVANPDDIFTDYAYFSSYSDSWVEHARLFCEMAQCRFGLGPASQVVEVASNDGYLLRHFLQMGVPVLGIEPAANVAKAAHRAGIQTEVAFFGTSTAQALRERGVSADLLVANNVLAHVPELNDFVAGLAQMVSPEGVISLEFPHILHLVGQTQFDTIYHEHFSYFSLLSLEHVLARHRLRIFDVEELSTHGGSLRVLACLPDAPYLERNTVARVKAKERASGLHLLSTYEAFADKVLHARRCFREFLDETKAAGDTIVAYGAAAKGNTLLNSTAATSNDIAYVVDRNPHKQGRYLPGSRIPIRGPEAVRESRPEVLLVLAWNLVEEIVQQMSYVKEWGCRFVVPIPTLRTIE